MSADGRSCALCHVTCRIRAISVVISTFEPRSISYASPKLDAPTSYPGRIKAVGILFQHRSLLEATRLAPPPVDPYHVPGVPRLRPRDARASSHISHYRRVARRANARRLLEVLSCSAAQVSSMRGHAPASVQMANGALDQRQGLSVPDSEIGSSHDCGYRGVQYVISATATAVR